MSAIDIMRREVAETYTSPEARAAYRAGMSTAAALCDERAAVVKAGNPGRGKGGVSQIGEFGAHVAKSCGDAISEAREEIHMHEPDGPNFG